MKAETTRVLGLLWDTCQTKFLFYQTGNFHFLFYYLKALEIYSLPLCINFAFITDLLNIGCCFFPTMEWKLPLSYVEYLFRLS